MESNIATVNIKIFHKNYLFLKENYPDYGERFVYFLATCWHLDPKTIFTLFLSSVSMVIFFVLIIRRLTNEVACYFS